MTIVALDFFLSTLNPFQLIILLSFLTIHIISHIYLLESEKIIIKKITHISSDNFFPELHEILFQNVFYLFWYTASMIAIEIIGKMAIKNAVIRTSKILLKADLSKIHKNKYEQMITSIVIHSENISASVHNLFIEFPHKMVTFYHFVSILKELSGNIVLYCILSTILFVSISIGLSFVRKYLKTIVLNANINLNVDYSDVANSIQSYKMDKRTNEIQTRLSKMWNDVWYYSSYDSIIVSGNDALVSLSGQFMIAQISYVCRPLILANEVAVGDLIYGIRASTKFIEKLIGIFEYVGDVIRQYKSFSFFVSTMNSTVVENRKGSYFITNIVFQSKIQQTFNVHQKNFIRIIGPNGVGKSTVLLNFMGVAYLGSTTNGVIQAMDRGNKKNIHRNKVAFVQQNIPLTHDTVEQYMMAISGVCSSSICVLEEMLNYFGIDNGVKNHVMDIGINKKINELSGGQAKFIQIVAAMMKVYVQQGMVVILDEPTNNLDYIRVGLLCEFLKACVDKNIMVILVTHDEQLVKNFNNMELCLIE